MNEWQDLCPPPLLEAYHEGAVSNVQPSIPYAWLYSSVFSLLIVYRNRNKFRFSHYNQKFNRFESEIFRDL